MNILIVYYSRNGHTARLAKTLTDELATRGACVVVDEIRVMRDWNKWLLPIPLLPLLPLLPLYLLSATFRRLWHRIYFQPSQRIQPMNHPDVRRFDRIVLGTPKWLYLSYPVARWLDDVRGIEGRTVFPFATFCGPPLEVFELQMLFAPLAERLRKRQALVATTLAVSSDYHPYFFFGEMEGLFRWLSKVVFKRPLRDFTLDGAIGQQEVRRFCDEVLRSTGDHLAGPAQ